MIDLSELDRFEDDLILKFKGHGIFQNLETMPLDDFLNVLIQRRFLSYEITTCYDISIDGLTDKKAVKIARQIVREEYPGANGIVPSHREDLMHDLLALGAKKSNILKSIPTQTTSEIIKSTKELIADAVASESDHKILTILRFWGEVLVSVEYGELWSRIASILGTNAENKSRFYYPHFCHDHRVTLVRASLSSCTHSGKIGLILKNLLKSDEDKRSFIDLEENLCRIKRSFYDQFIAV